MTAKRSITGTLFLALSLMGCGHVDRQMTFVTQPAGALVYLNGQEVGRTPCTVDFTWYGRYDLALRKEGYETTKSTPQISAPWWQWIPLDFAADVLPGRKLDHRTLTFSLTPLPEQGIDPSVLVDRANSMRPLLESGEFTRKPPATMPATLPATTAPAESTNALDQTASTAPATSPAE